MRTLAALARSDPAVAGWAMPEFEHALSVPPVIAAFIRRCLTPDPGARPDTTDLLA